jgi:hypothetical protein
MTMAQSPQSNEKANSKLNDRPLAVDELDRVSGGVSNLPGNLEKIVQQEHPEGLGLPHVGDPRA